MKRKVHNEKLRKWRARSARTTRAIARSVHPQVCVFRSSKHLYAQIIDPATGQTVCSVSTRTKGVVASGNTGNVEAAKALGKALAEKAREKQIGRAVFNRNGFLYHGRGKALVEAAREAGLQL